MPPATDRLYHALYNLYAIIYMLETVEDINQHKVKSSHEIPLNPLSTSSTLHLYLVHKGDKKNLTYNPVLTINNHSGV